MFEKTIFLILISISVLIFAKDPVSSVVHRYSGMLSDPINAVISVGNHDVYLTQIPDEEPSVWEWESFDDADDFEIVRSEMMNSTIFKSSTTNERKPIFRIYYNQTLHGYFHEATGNVFMSIHEDLNNDNRLFILNATGPGILNVDFDIESLIFFTSSSVRCHFTGSVRKMVIINSTSSAFINAYDLEMKSLMLIKSNQTKIILGTVATITISDQWNTVPSLYLREETSKDMLIFNGRKTSQFV